MTNCQSAPPRIAFTVGLTDKNFTRVNSKPTTVVYDRVILNQSLGTVATFLVLFFTFWTFRRSWIRARRIFSHFRRVCRPCRRNLPFYSHGVAKWKAKTSFCRFDKAAWRFRALLNNFAGKVSFKIQFLQKKTILAINLHHVRRLCGSKSASSYKSSCCAAFCSATRIFSTPFRGRITALRRLAFMN